MKKTLLFLICLQKMVFVTRFADAFKGYIYSYFANLEREIAESFDGFWKVTGGDTYTSDGFLNFTNTPS